MKKLIPADVQPIGEVLAAVNKVETILAARNDVQAAINRLTPRGIEANRTVDSLKRRRADMLAAQALETDPDLAKAHSRSLDLIEPEQAAAARELEAVESAQRALEAKLDEADARLIELKNSQLPYTLMAQNNTVAQVLQRRLDEIVEKHLLPFVLEVNAMRSATGAFVDWTEAFAIHQILAPTNLMLNGTRHFESHRSISLLDSWAEDADLAVVADVAAGPRIALQRLRTAAARAEERAAQRQSEAGAGVAQR